MKIVIIEDERDLAELLSFNLEKEGYEVFIALEGKKGIELVTNERPDLLLLDLMLPDMSGTEICKFLKNQPATSAIPIMMLTAKGEEIDRVVGFEVGADDYVVKPFSSRELILRIKALLRRSAPEKSKEVLIKIGPLVIDEERHVVASELLRDDFRGQGKISAYQIMGMAGTLYSWIILPFLVEEGTALPDLLKGVGVLWAPMPLLSMQLIWGGIFFYTGRSRVTGSMMSFHVEHQKT